MEILKTCLLRIGLGSCILPVRKPVFPWEWPMVTQFPGAPVKGGCEKAGASKRPYGFRSESSTSTLEVAMLLQGTKARLGDRCDYGVAAQEKYPVGIA